MTDQITLCNEALVLLGEAPIDDLDSAATPETVALLLYQSTVDQLLGSHPWTFNRNVVTLSRISAAPAAATQFSAQYQLPDLCFRIVAAYVNAVRVTEWGEAQAKLYIDAGVDDVVELEYHTRAAPYLWRPAFRQAVVLGLAAAFALPITDEPAKTKLFTELHTRQLALARHLNASEKPAIRLQTGRLARLRGGVTRW